MKFFLTILVIIASIQPTQGMIAKALARFSVTAQVRAYKPAARFFCTDTTNKTAAHQCADCAKLPKKILRWLELGFSGEQLRDLENEELKHPKIAQAIRLFTQFQSEKEHLWTEYQVGIEGVFDEEEVRDEYFRATAQLTKRYQEEKEKLLSHEQK